MQLDKHERNKLIGKILKSTDKDYSDNPELISRLFEFKEKSIPMSNDSDLMNLLPQNVRNNYANKILNDAIK